MRGLYITADTIGTKSGGGRVTFEEYSSLSHLVNGLIDPIDRLRFGQLSGDPFEMDDKTSQLLQPFLAMNKVDIAHFYAGTFTKTIELLKRHGVKISYTCAAHDRKISSAEFELMEKKPSNLEHLKDGPLWDRYLSGYKQADLLIVPSEHSKNVMIMEGCDKHKITVIPHGTDVVEKIPSFPKQFTVGYLGSAGYDKGLWRLFSAWKKAKLNLPTDVLLLIGGPTNQIPMMMDYFRYFGGGNVRCIGFVPTIDEFFERISVYVQPSVTEGFGIEILEAMAYGRPVIASEAAGAVDLVRRHECGAVVKPEVENLQREIEWCYKNQQRIQEVGKRGHDVAGMYSWQRVSQQYLQAWAQLLGNDVIRRRNGKTVKIGSVSFTVPPVFENLDWTSDSDVIEKYWNVRVGDVCIDVGTGPGVWSLCALKAGAGEVIAFDPRDVSENILRRMTMLNDAKQNLTFERVGLMNTTGQMPFSESSFMWNTNGESSIVDVTTLDAYVNGRKTIKPITKIDFINIDAEGAELQVLDGAQETLRRFRPTVLVDVHDNISITDLMARFDIMQPHQIDWIGKYLIVTPLV